MKTILQTPIRKLALVGLLLVGLGGSAWAQSPNVSVFATGLEYPRGLKFGPDGNLYVAEAGAGGSMSTSSEMCDQVVPPVGPYTGGFTGRVSKITAGAVVTTVADNLPSEQNAMGDIAGPGDLAFIGRTLYVLDSAGCSHGFSDTPSAVLRIGKDGSSTPIADLSAFQRANPVENPEPDDFEPDGTWYSMVAVNKQLVAVEPNHGEVDLIHLDGRIKRIADISASQGHIVPTAMVYNGESLLIGNLGTFPITDGAEEILKVNQRGQVKVFATGFTTILGLALDKFGKLYVLENTTGGNQFPTPGTGKILRVRNNGTTQEIATGLDLPTAMTIGPDGNIYVSDWGFGPPGMGQILKVTLP